MGEKEREDVLVDQRVDGRVGAQLALGGRHVPAPDAVDARRHLRRIERRVEPDFDEVLAVAIDTRRTPSAGANTEKGCPSPLATFAIILNTGVAISSRNAA